VIGSIVRGLVVLVQLVCFIIGPWVIRTLAAWRIGQLIREEGPESHRAKAGTPTMGGVLILFCVAVPTLLWGRLENGYLWLALLTTLAFGAIGFADDYLKLVRRRNLGLTGRWKLAAQALVALGFALRSPAPGRRSRRASASRSSRAC
jgi:phospho-N-acetylmuramoyl-pentapeptide-transferase